MNHAELQAQLIDDIASFTHDPLGFARYAYDWENGDLRQWQKDVAGAIGKHLQDPKTRHQPCLIAVSSGHGIGKSAEIGMLIDWAMSTCEECKVVITAGTGTQLATKTVPEVHKWFRKSINADWWDINATSIRVTDPAYQATWRADFITWSEHNTEAFAGLHNQGKRVLLVFDEGSAIADKVYEVAEGAMTDEDTEIIWVVFGNPTKNTGRFRECFGKYRHRWKTFQIDSRAVEGTNKEQIAKWVADYGEDSDWVRVRVRGEFPRAGSNQFISSDDVAACRKYKAESYAHMPKILAIDVARFGDDRTVIVSRQGRFSRILAKYRGLDTVQTSERAIEFIQKERPDAVVVDGDGLGAGVVDHLTHRGFRDKVFEFHGGGEPRDKNMYFNRRAEVWGMMRDWLKAGAEIPDDAELAEELAGVEYGFASKSDAIQLEKKEDMKARGMASPDLGDALAMTFAVTVKPKPKPQIPPTPRVSAWA